MSDQILRLSQPVAGRALQKADRKQKQRLRKAAERQAAYRQRLKNRRKPTTEDIAIVYFHYVTTHSTRGDARRYFNTLLQRLADKLVDLGFDPIASRIAIDDLVERYQSGENLTRGPKISELSPDISSYRSAVPESPHYSMSHGDAENPGQSIAEFVVVEETAKSKFRVLRLSTAHLPDTDLQNLLEDFVFGGDLDVHGTDTTLSIQVDWQIVERDTRFRDLADRGYTKDLVYILCAATDEADVVAFDRDGPLCPELRLFEGNVPVCKAVMEVAE